MQIWINPSLKVPKLAWWTGCTYIRALNSLKSRTLMSSVFPKHIMFQLESFIGIIVMSLKGDAKVKEKMTRGLKIDLRNLVNVLASSPKSENFHFDGPLSSKAYKVLRGKVQKAFVSWYWRVIHKEKLILEKYVFYVWYNRLAAVGGGALKIFHNCLGWSSFYS